MLPLVVFIVAWVFAGQPAVEPWTSWFTFFVFAIAWALAPHPPSPALILNRYRQTDANANVVDDDPLDD